MSESIASPDRAPRGRVSSICGTGSSRRSVADRNRPYRSRLPNATDAARLPCMRKELNCSIFRAMDVLGDRWTLMVLREAFMGVRRFTEMQRDLGVARNVLT